MSDDLIGTYLGQYRLISVIGRGGMATVYKAYQTSLDRFVAIKLILSNGDAEFVARFKREARMSARLQHPNILTVHDHGEQNGRLYLVLQYIENGNTLTELLGRPMLPVQAMRLIGHVLDGLDYAHTGGIIHRDIKPSNILMASSRWPMLGDFGIAKLRDDSQAFTQPGMLMGTAAYMAPEQAFGRPADVRTDIYAVGIVLYEMLTGRVPFDADTPVAMLHQHAYEAPPPPRSLNPNLSEALEAVLLQALAKNPDHRYQTAAEMSTALEQAVSQPSYQPAQNRLTDLYRAGVQAFEIGDWDRAIERLSRVVILDETNETAADLLAAARETKARAMEAAHKPASQPPAVDLHQQLAIPMTRSVEPSVAHVPDVFTTQRQGIQLPGQASDSSVEEVTPARAGTRWLWPAIGGALFLATLFAARPSFQSMLLAPRPTDAAQSTALTAPIQLVAQPTALAVPTATDIPTIAATSLPVASATASISPAASATTAPTATSEPTATWTPVPLPDAAAAAAVNLRRGPATSFPTIKTYERGTALRVTGKMSSGDWLQVQTPDDQTGWMSTKNLQLNIDLAGIPVVAAPPSPTPQPAPKPRPTAIPQPTATPPPPTPLPAIEAPSPAPAPADTPSPTRKPRRSGGGGGGCGGNCPPPPP